ncbi:hypothetical protein BB559_000382 [Furculomyces boomerangus]|uniref:Uncharacterized protein n=2 Tax=Harpellales TaxID=61421 RepID=A0A2T9Z5F1_9FUNG|nr:hypothetical protein BB559_000382 [Furculomyces boomerangus]PVZ99215.1 hypothetical protein BB558_004757 [Smittium angustum]
MNDTCRISDNWIDRWQGKNQHIVNDLKAESVLSKSENPEKIVFKPSKHFQNKLETPKKSTQAIPISSVENSAKSNLSFNYKEVKSPSKETRNCLKTLDNLLNNSGGKVPAYKERVETPKGMSIKLLDHQKIALAWSIKQELNKEARGGILADDMGLGKTVTMIALMMSRNPEILDKKKGITNSEPRSHRTLVIAPLAMTNQWAEECTKKTTKNMLDVYIYHGQSRNRDPNFLKNVDVVITTYDIVAAEWPMNKESRMIDLDSEKRKIRDERIIKMSKGSGVFGVRWRRIILDEAHKIKNPSSIASRACSDLFGRYRWCVSGTPLQNKLEDIYPLTRFLRYYPYSLFAHFKDEIIRIEKIDQPAAFKKLYEVLENLMLRRTKDDMLDGKRIIILPERNVKFEFLNLSETEKEFYQMLHSYLKTSARNSERSGGGSSNFTELQGYLVRMRQAVCHPTLINLFKNAETDANIPSRAVSKSTMSREEEEKYRTLEKKISNMNPSVRSKLALASINLMDIFCDHCAEFNTIDSALILPCCGDIICLDCVTEIIDLSESKLSDVYDSENNTLRCPECDTIFDADGFVFIGEFKKFVDVEKAKKFQVGDRFGIISDDESSDSDNSSVEDGSRFGYGTDGFDFGAKAEDQVFEEKDVSISELKHYFKNNLELNVIEYHLDSYGLQWARYDGSMNSKQREEQLYRFRNDDNVCIMLVSKMAGSLGLNLTVANVVIITDLWWNPAIENQAIDRVHRIGQTKPVRVHCLVCRDTIDEKILNMQKTKQVMTELVLGDGASGLASKNFKLNMKELRSLFFEGQ